MYRHSARAERGTSKFGTPIRLRASPRRAADEPMAMSDLAGNIRETVQKTLYKLLAKRSHPFTGPDN
jgi:hypothetical protein